MLNYEVLSEEEAMQERYQILSAGEYDAVVIDSQDKVSANSGNPMMEVSLHVYDKEGKTHAVKDYLVFTKSMMWKVIHCAASADLMMHYTTGRFCSNSLLSKRVRVKLGVEEGKEIPVDKLNGRELGAKYPSKNKVEDYLKMKDRMPLPNALPTDTDEDDDVPF